MKGKWALVIWIGLLLIALWTAGLGREAVLNPYGFQSLSAFLARAFSPEVNVSFLSLIAEASLKTLAFALCATLLALFLGFIGGILRSHFWWHNCLESKNASFISSFFGYLFGIPAAIHEVIWALFFLSLIGLDMMVGVFAIAIPFGAMATKVFSQFLDDVDPAPTNFLIQNGTSPVLAFFYGAFSQAFPNMVSYSFYRFECALRSAAVLGIIGAGGIGYQIQISLSSLKYGELWTGFYALILLNGCVDFLSSRIRKIFGFLGSNDNGQRKKSSTPDLSRTYLALVAFFLCTLSVLLSLWFLSPDLSKWGRIFTQFHAFSGTLSAKGIVDSFTISHVVLSLDTFSMSVIAMTIAGIFGVLFSFPAALNMFSANGVLMQPKRKWGVVLYVVTRFFLLVWRAIPAPIIALVLLFAMYPSILAGALALAIHNIGILGRLNAEVNEHMEERNARYLRQIGSSSLSVYLYAILPMNVRAYLGYVFYRWEVCIRETLLLGLVGAGGLGLLLSEEFSSFDNNGALVTVAVFVGLTLIVNAFGRRLVPA